MKKELKIAVILILLCVCNIEVTYSQNTVNTINSPPPDTEFVQLKSSQVDPSDLVVLKVPPYIWSYGCSNTAAAMLIGYYDQNGFPTLYKGGMNGGIAPFNNSLWTKNYLPGSIVNHKNSISASMNGFDGRVINGNFDNFWVKVGNINNDPHPWVGDNPPVYINIHPCTADYMGTSQDHFNTADGATNFIISKNHGNKIIDSPDWSYPTIRDGLHGLRMFIEDCGYTVVENFNQKIAGYNNISAGFTFNDFKAEIDAGRPVLISFTNHMAIGIGYSSSTNKIRIYTTWSETPWDMVYGSNLTANPGKSYVMEHAHVIKLQPSGLPTGIYDKVEIMNPPTGTIGAIGAIPNNTNLMTACSNASFWANFTTDNNPTTYANTFDWSIELYHATGSYIYAQQNGILPNTSTPSWFGQGCVWQPALAVLPAYDWSIDYNGNIFGQVFVTVHLSDGSFVSNKAAIEVNPYQNIQNITYSTNATINACAKLVLTNVIITSTPTIIFNTGGKGITINAPFQAQKGSTLTINK